MPLTGPQLVHAIRRNFGGLEESGVDPEKVFFDKLPKDLNKAPDQSTVSLDVSIFIHCRNYVCFKFRSGNM